MLFFFPCRLWPSFLPLSVLFFCFFPFSRSGAPDVKRPRYGFILFYFGYDFFFFFFRGGIDSTSASPAPQNYGFCYHCPPQLFTSPQCLIPPLLPEVFLVISSHAHSTSWSHQPSSAFIFSLFLLPSFLCRPPRPCAFLHRHTNLCPHPFCPCPMAHVLDLHLWPHLTPTTWPWGTKVTLFCYPFRFCLEGRRNKKMYEKCVFVGQVKNVSRLSFTNTSRWKCCRMCRVSRHHSVDIPIVWHFEGFQRSTVYDLILSWNVCYIYCCVFNVSNEHCMLFLFTVLPLQICCTAMPFLLWTLFLADNLSHIYASFIMTNDRFVYFGSQIFKVKPTLRCHYFLSLRLCSGFYFDLSLPLTSRCVVSIGKSVKAKFTRARK